MIFAKYRGICLTVIFLLLQLLSKAKKCPLLACFENTKNTHKENTTPLMHEREKPSKVIDFQTLEKTAQLTPERSLCLSLSRTPSLSSSTMSSPRNAAAAAPPRHQQTPAGNCRTRLLLPPSSAHITSLLEKKVIDTVSKATNHRAPRRGRVPDCNVYVRARPMGVQWRGRGILLEERGKTIFYPPNRAAFWIAGAAAAAS